MNLIQLIKFWYCIPTNFDLKCCHGVAMVKGNVARCVDDVVVRLTQDLPGHGGRPQTSLFTNNLKQTKASTCTGLVWFGLLYCICGGLTIAIFTVIVLSRKLIPTNILVKYWFLKARLFIPANIYSCLGNRESKDTCTFLNIHYSKSHQQLVSFCNLFFKI